MTSMHYPRAQPASRVWMSTTSVVLSCLTVCAILLLGLSLLLFSPSMLVPEPEDASALTPLTLSWGEIVILLLTPLVVTFWLWVPAMVFAVMSPWWRPGEKALVTLSPLVAMVGVTLSLPAAQVVGVAGLAVSVLWQGGLMYVLVTLARAASRRATAAGRTAATR